MSYIHIRLNDLNLSFVSFSVIESNALATFIAKRSLSASLMSMCIGTIHSTAEETVHPDLASLDADTLDLVLSLRRYQIKTRARTRQS